MENFFFCDYSFETHRQTFCKLILIKRAISKLLCELYLLREAIIKRTISLIPPHVTFMLFNSHNICESTRSVNDKLIHAILEEFFSISLKYNEVKI